MKRHLSAFSMGVLFAIGLGVAGMTRPEKVIGFLNVSDWDPALLFVMAGAMMTYMALYQLIKRRATPLVAPRFEVPTRTDLNWRLVLGSLVFGIGWALSGFCPAPAVVSLISGALPTLAFVVAMGVGMVAYRFFEAALAARRTRALAAATEKRAYVDA